MTDSDSYGAVLPLRDGTCVRLRDAQAVAGRLLAISADQRAGTLRREEAAEMMGVLDGLEKEARPIRLDDRVRDGADGQIAFLKLLLELARHLEHGLRVSCVRCGRQLSAGSADVRLELTADGEAAFSCTGCRPTRLAGHEGCQAI